MKGPAVVRSGTALDGTVRRDLCLPVSGTDGAPGAEGLCHAHPSPRRSTSGAGVWGMQAYTQ